MTRFKIVATLVVSFFLFGTTYYACQGMTPAQITEFASKKCNEGNCLCSNEVQKIVDGENYNIEVLRQYARGMTAEHMLTHGGSENIPVTCRAGLYLVENDPSWFLEYFAVQKRADIGLGNQELFSAGYFQQSLGHALLVLNHAIQKGHTQLEQAAAEWAKAYWAYLALASTPNSTRTFTYKSFPPPTGTKSHPNGHFGYGVGVVGTRAYPTQVRGVGTQSVFLALALDRPARSSSNLKPYGVHGGFRAFLVKTGFRGNSNDDFNLLQRSHTPREVGLTETDRAKLVEFINSNGTVNLDYVLNMIRPFPLFCEITFLRTTSGLITWYGNSERESNTCTPIKGGAYSAVSIVGDRGEILVRVKKDKDPTMGRVWRDGNQICSSSDMPTECIDIPGGNVVYEVSVGRSGAVCKAGACGGGGTPPPPPNPTPSTTTTTMQQPPASNPPSYISNCSHPGTLCLLGGRYQLAATWHNQFSNTSGNATAVRNTDVSGFFHFGDPSNIELITKVLNFNGTIKVFYGQLTNLRFTLYVRDSRTGTTRAYQNTPGDCGGLDNNAFTASFKIPKNEAVAKADYTSPRMPAAGNCRANANTLCLQGGRVKVTATWRNHYDGSSGTATVRPLTQVTGGLYFSDNSNLELLVKAVDFGSHYLVMYGTLSNLEYDLTVTDTVNGKTKTYHNAAANYCGGMDSVTFTK